MWHSEVRCCRLEGRIQTSVSHHTYTQHIAAWRAAGASGAQARNAWCTARRLWAAVKRSWQRSRCCWITVLLLLAVLILVIALPAALVRRPGPPPPSFLFQPQQLSATNTSLDFTFAVDKVAFVHYVLLPVSDGIANGWSKLSSADVQLASQGLGRSSWEVSCSVQLAPVSPAIGMLHFCCACVSLEPLVYIRLQTAALQP